MAEFYHNLVTEKSFKVLQDLKQKFRFILIGGWAIFLYTKALKSKDVDIILDFEELGKFKKEFTVFKNERLKKYEVKMEEIDVDIYLPFFSNLGLPIEEIKQYCQMREGFLLPIPEILLILKAHILQERRGTVKGRKDIIDIFSLISQKKIDWQKYRELIKKYKLKKENQELKGLISSTISVPELGLLDHQMSRLKKKVLKEIDNKRNF